MPGFLIRTLISALGLWIAARLVPSMHFDGAGTLLLAALLLGVVNAIVRPVLVLLTLPITLLTLGLFYLVVNGIAFAMAAALVPGFTVASLGSAVWGSLVVALVSWLFAWLIRAAHEPRA